MGLTAVDNRAGNAPWAPLDFGQVSLVGYLLASISSLTKSGWNSNIFRKLDAEMSFVWSA